MLNLTWPTSGRYKRMLVHLTGTAALVGPPDTGRGTCPPRSGSSFVPINPRKSDAFLRHRTDRGYDFARRLWRHELPGTDYKLFTGWPIRPACVNRNPWTRSSLVREPCEISVVFWMRNKYSGILIDGTRTLPDGRESEIF